MSTSTEVQKNTFLLLPINQMQNKTFVIGNYQRGYKWGKKEILELLNDINEYDSHSGLYCLQPVILKPLSSATQKIEVDKEEFEIYTKNEVIDGQQRTTTLYLLLSYLKFIGAIDAHWGYTIDFTTRERSGIFLKDKLQELFMFNPDRITDNEIESRDYSEVTVINALWREFIQQHKEYDTVDVYHFFTVGCYIKKWCSIYLNETGKLNEFVRKLLDNVKVIWYSLDSSLENDKVIEVFLNNNKGKIKLTTSELIKALFILEIKRSEINSIADLKVNQFALEWDVIEKKLQEDSFWYFIQPNEDLYTEGTRIDYLFDLHLGKKSQQDEMFAYRFYETAYNNTDRSFNTEWDKIIQLFNKLIDWYNDQELFHFVGYLTNAHVKSLQDIIKKAIGKNKEETKLLVKEFIEIDFMKQSKDEKENFYFVYQLDNLHFKTHYTETKKVLLLHNVMYYVSSMSNHKFPFELYVKEKWSIEHIIPQNPKEISDFELYKSWFKEQTEYQSSYGENRENEVLLLLDSKKSFEELKADKDLELKINKLIENFEDRTHVINNLLLLDRNTNSALQNEGFAHKREKILQFDRNGKSDTGKAVFIPVETLNAFNKTFSREINYKHWTFSDGEAYKTAIEKRLTEFLPQNIVTDDLK